MQGTRPYLVEVEEPETSPEDKNCIPKWSSDSRDPHGDHQENQNQLGRADASDAGHGSMRLCFRHHVAEQWS